MTNQKFEVPSGEIPPGEPVARLSLGTVATIATLGGVAFGYDTGVINGALTPMSEEFGLTPATEGWVTSTLLIGCAVGALVGGRLSDRYGRRHNLLMLSMIFIIGTLGCVFAPSFAAIIPFRFILGVGVGGASVTVPVYLSEVAPYEKRGSITNRNELGIVSAQFAAFVINAIIGTVWGAHEGVWRYMLAVAVLPAIGLFIGMMRMPESPRWLSAQGRAGESLEVLTRLRDEPARAIAEEQEIRALIETERHMPKAGWADLKIKWVRRLILIGAGLAMTQQLSGVNSVMYYGSQLLAMAGFSQSASLIANTLNGVAAVTGCLLALAIVNKVGRRKLMITGLIATTSMHALIGTCAFVIPDSSAVKPWFILLFVVLFIFAINSTYGALVWILLAEIFPLRLRGLAQGICVFILWVTNAVVTFLFPQVVSSVGIGSTFFGFAAIGVICLIFAIIKVPETRGKSLEQVEEEMKARLA